MIQNHSGVSRNADATHLLGNTAETIVKLELLSKGYFIYSNDFAHGPADIIALKPEPNPEILMVDVKSDSKRWLKGRNQKTRISRKRTATQKKLGIVFAYVDPETGEVHWAKHHKL
jgi:Holliday junction resolvase-like predicted endonuclease